MSILGTGPVACVTRGEVTVHWWPSAAKTGDPCLCGAKAKAATPDDRMEAAARELDRRAASVHERVSCPKCAASVGRRCRRVGTFVSDSPPLKHSHRERLAADGIPLR